MEQKIEAPTDTDVDCIARQLIHADAVAREAVGHGLDGSRDDLTAIQTVLDAGVVERDATYTLQALGIAFGNVFIKLHLGYDWWMVEDEHGRTPAIRFERTSLLAFPQTMISKRVEDGESVDVWDLFEQLSRRLAELSDRQQNES